MTRLEKAGVQTVGAAIIVAVAATLYLAVTPMYEGISGPATASDSRTLAEMNGPHVYLILLLPVALACLPLLIRQPRPRRVATWLAGFVLTGFCVVSAWTVGVFYAPAALSLLLAAILLTVGSRGRRAGRATDFA